MSQIELSGATPTAPLLEKLSIGLSAEITVTFHPEHEYKISLAPYTAGAA
ncbi:hypothetical protein [Streptomyces triticagri]|nr:hypothetical protein [Streptomyces triticagri]